MVKIVVFFAFSLSETLSANTVFETMFIPAHPIPRTALPKRSMGKALVGAPAHRALPMSMKMIDSWIEAYRPKESAHWAHTGMKTAEVRLNDSTIQSS